MEFRWMLIIFVMFAFASFGQAQEDASWDLMTKEEIGVDRFLSQYPDFDGKGVIIAVMDTGVDMGVEGLKTLPDGGVKVVECRDFTGEGDLLWEEGRLVPDGEGGEKLVDSEGQALKGFRKAAEGALYDRYFLVFLEEKKFSDTSVSDMNGDGDSKDTFGILLFTVKDEKECTCEKKEEGEEAKPSEEKAPEEANEANEAEEKKEEGTCECKKEGSFRYEAVVDVNGDGNLDDGVRLTDYYRKHQTFVLKGKKGDRKQLTMALNFYPDEKRLSVHFDDGGHGTHVAGIAAGYKIHGQEGYNGMAPGAKVMSLKIGNNRYAGGSTVTESVKKALDFGAQYAKDHKVPVVFNMSYSIGSEREGKSAIDNYVNDLLWKNPSVVFVTSASNDGPALSSIGTPATAERAITVGALLGPKAAAAQYGCNLDYEVLFSFSSRGGDTYKPDILAPGSAASTVPPWGDRDHMNGTSMSSPAATGAIALLVDGLARHDPPFEVDNRLIHRAVKNTGRHVEGWGVLDEGGGALDVPAAYAYAKYLCEQKEGSKIREYRIRNLGPAPGEGVAYWRNSPYVPRKTEAMNFRIQAGFPDGITKEEKAQFYRAFDLKPEVDWLSLTKPMVYLKGEMSATVGVMADLSGKPPGLYAGRIMAVRKSEDRISGSPIYAFDLVVSVFLPHRITPENRGRLQTSGQLKPGRLDRVYVEVPSGITALTMELRMLDGGQASVISAGLIDPEGVARGGSGSVSEPGRTVSSRTIQGPDLVPGIWEIVVNSSIRSRVEAQYDLAVTLSGGAFGDPQLFAPATGPVRKHLLIPFRCTQPYPFNGNVKGRIDGLVMKEMMKVEDSDCFTRTVHLDNSYSGATWTLDFDRETFALFTDCVLRIEEADTGKTIRNTGFSQRSSSVSLSVPKDQKSSKAYKLVLKPAFSLKKDHKNWRFILTEKLTWRTGSLALELVDSKDNNFKVMPWDWKNLEFSMPAQLPVAPDGYGLHGVFEATTAAPAGMILRKYFNL